MDHLGVKLVPDRAALKLVDRHGIAVIREFAGFAEEDSCGLFGRQVGDGAIGGYDDYHLGTRIGSER